MLRGNYLTTVDAKGRLKIPTVFKTYLDENFGQEFYVTSLEGQFVWVYPFKVWREVEEKLAALPRMKQAKKKFLDRTNYWGQLVRMDGQGRVLIPAQLRDSAVMRGEVAVLGYLDHLEVWNTERYREHMEREPLTTDDLEGLGI